MGRQTLQKGLILIPGLLIAATVTGITYYRMEDAKKDLEVYWLAKSCPGEDNCRNKVEATILGGEEKTITINSISKHGITRTFRNTTYNVSVSVEDNTQELEIPSNPPSNGTAFDISNVQIPTGRDSRFAEVNFHKDQPAYVETWRGTITLLYLDTILDDPYQNMLPESSIGSQPTTITGLSRPGTYEIALPTAIHPIFLQASTEYNFRSTILICSVLMVLLLFALFNEEINGAWKRMSSENLLKGRTKH